MLVAYIDEFGHEGPYISPTHPKYHQHPVFGYAGMVLPASAARTFGAHFKRQRNNLFKTLVDAHPTPSQFEKKGNEYFSTGSIEAYPSHVRVYQALLRTLYSLGGSLFYFGYEKPVGTVKETGMSSRDIVEKALRETINRISRHADGEQSDVLIIADAITDKTRREIASQMYAHIYSRSSSFPEMRRAVEVPLHIESKLNSNVQFADWTCALVARASHYQLVRGSQFEWAPRLFGAHVRGHFTYESVIHTHAVGDKIMNSALFNASRPRFPVVRPGTLGASNPKLAAFYDTLRADSASVSSR